MTAAMGPRGSPVADGDAEDEQGERDVGQSRARQRARRKTEEA